MARNTIRDILPPEGRRPPRRTLREGEENRPRTPQPTPFPLRPERIARMPSKGNFPWFSVVGGIVAVVAVTALALSFLFTGAKITVTPKQEGITVNGVFTAYKNPEGKELGYEVMTLELTQTESLPATERKHVEEKASGKIVVYNDFNTLDQRLIRNTRFETPDGLIFRINESVTVPGRYTKGGETFPGSIEVTVYADEPGGSYNIGLTDFTIPGFKGAPQFERFYARSKTPMSGGFIGEKLIVDPKLSKEARKNLQATLQQAILNQASSEKPDGFLTFDAGLFVEFEMVPDVEKDNRVELTEKAILHGILFKEENLAKVLARNTLAGYDESSVRIFDKGTLTFSIVTTDVAMPWNSNMFSFGVEGSGVLEWTFDEFGLRRDLAGRNKDAIHTILSGYPGISRAEAVIQPFWKSTFPEDVEDITIELKRTR
jgi:hypothetical protein